MSGLSKTRQKLLENFDEEVHEKLRVKIFGRAAKVLGKYDTLALATNALLFAAIRQVRGRTEWFPRS